MNLSTGLYLADVLHSIGCTLSMLSAFGLVGWVIASAIYMACLSDDALTKKQAIKFKKHLRLGWMIIPMILIACLCPAQRTMYMIMGANYLQESNLPPKVAKAFEMKLDGYIEELVQEKHKRGKQDE